jgi:hypothetical protein
VRIEYQTARNGDTTVVVDGRHLHSRYNPRREASRFLESITLDHPEGVVILVGDGTGVVLSELQKKHPRTRVLALPPVIADQDSGSPRMAVPREYAGTIRANLHPLDVTAVQLLTWPGAEGALPEWTEAVHETVLASIREMQAELATVGSFGRLWFLNALRRSIMLDEHATVQFTGGGILCAAAGPGLADLLHDFPVTERSRVPLIAASSALRWLDHHQFRPVLAVHTDGGVWARRYAFDAERNNTVVALPLRASTTRSGPVLPVRIGWIGELLAPDSDRWIHLPEEPTVGATLLDLAHELAPTVPLVAIGLDLCSRDLLGHARPHRNDQFIAAQSDRLHPEETIRAWRTGLAEASLTMHPCRWHDGATAWQSPTLQMYRHSVAAAIERHRRNAPVSFQSPSPVWAEECPQAGETPRPAGSFKITSVKRPSRGERFDHANRRILSWREEVSGFPGKTPRRPVSRTFLDLILHLAPVEALQWTRGTLPWEITRESCTATLNGMLLRMEHWR